jgi:hypothetical protein
VRIRKEEIIRDGYESVGERAVRRGDEVTWWCETNS